jgi:hypothetical protein
VRELVRARELVGFELTEFETPSNPENRARAIQAVIRMTEPLFLAGDWTAGSGFTNLALEAGPVGYGHAVDGGGFRMFLHEFHSRTTPPIKPWRSAATSGSLPRPYTGRNSDGFHVGPYATPICLRVLTLFRRVQH